MTVHKFEFEKIHLQLLLDGLRYVINEYEFQPPDGKHNTEDEYKAAKHLFDLLELALQIDGVDGVLSDFLKTNNVNIKFTDGFDYQNK